MPRGLRHMIGILVRIFECGLDIELNHLLNLLEIKKAPKGDRVYISNKSNRRIIGGFPSKDQFWTERFFYVLVCLVWNILPPILAARRVNWRRHFTFKRVERARAILAGVPVSSSSSNSSLDTREKMVIITLRDKKRREEEEAARRAAEAAQTETEASSRPPTSVLQKHDSGRKRSAADKGKGVAIQKDKPTKKKRKQAPGDPAARKLVVDDPDASAMMFSRVNNAKTRLPPPEKLRRLRSYGAMAQRGTKFVAAINELMAEYEADLSKVERRLDEARNETAAAKGKLDEAMTKVSRLEEEKIVLRADVDKVSASVIRLEEARRAKSAEVALLKRRMEAKDALFNAKVKRAKKKARRELTAKFQERLAKVEEGLAKLEKAKTDENELGQIKGNLAMIVDLRKPDAPTLDDDEAKLKSWESEYTEVSWSS
ncbi:uncharacterized protein At3g60930, chloroplastic-like [Eutrema salsugineum]|uniref:uncharacterized protein At3g60930, chloroplastic-like n=1 Tax=Eutrema salsugineum TaxID=72664 RepID=UPI000CED10D7|nr:uncharacterized protein At3g60930, chloroplastic-like [Eutrema salsugineum]